MSSTGASPDTSADVPEAGTIDLKLEVVTLPVSDVDRAKAFYASLGWRLDIDRRQRGLPDGAVHAAALAVLDPVRQGAHDG